MRYKGIHFAGSAGPVVRAVVEAGRDMGATEFEIQLLLTYLSVESYGTAKFTFDNPELVKYKDNPEKRPSTGRANFKYRGPFQILVNKPIEKELAKNHGYDTRKFGDPYHQAQVILKKLRAETIPNIKKMTSDRNDQLMLFYLTHNQGLYGIKDIYRLSKDPKYKNVPFRQIPNAGSWGEKYGGTGKPTPDRQFYNPRTGTSFPHSNFSKKRFKTYGMTSIDQLTPAIFIDMWRKNIVTRMGGKAKSSSEELKIQTKNAVFILGDSNTTPHRNFWFAYARKNFGKDVQPVSLAVRSCTIRCVKRRIDKYIRNTKPKAIIIGSMGGNDAQNIFEKSKNTIVETLSENGSYYQRHIIPLMEKLKEYQEKGTEIRFFGLPYGSGKGNKAFARKEMDKALQRAAEQYNIPYSSVFEGTREVKGEDTGVHYGKKLKQYRNVLATGIGEMPTQDEVDYAANTYKSAAIITKLRNTFLTPYRVIQQIGWPVGSSTFDFEVFYDALEETLGEGCCDFGKKYLSGHGQDRIFGPEHYSAYIALYNNLQNTEMKKVIDIAKEKARNFSHIAGRRSTQQSTKKRGTGTPSARAPYISSHILQPVSNKQAARDEKSLANLQFDMSCAARQSVHRPMDWEPGDPEPWMDVCKKGATSDKPVDIEPPPINESKSKVSIKIINKKVHNIMENKKIKLIVNKIRS